MSKCDVILTGSSARLFRSYSQRIMEYCGVGENAAASALVSLGLHFLHYALRMGGEEGLCMTLVGCQAIDQKDDSDPESIICLPDTVIRLSPFDRHLHTLLAPYIRTELKLSEGEALNYLLIAGIIQATQNIAHEKDGRGLILLLNDYLIDERLIVTVPARPPQVFDIRTHPSHWPARSLCS